MVPVMRTICRRIAEGAESNERKRLNKVNAYLPLVHSWEGAQDYSLFLRLNIVSPKNEFSFSQHWSFLSVCFVQFLQ